MVTKKRILTISGSGSLNLADHQAMYGASGGAGQPWVTLYLPGGLAVAAVACYAWLPVQIQCSVTYSFIQSLSQTFWHMASPTVSFLGQIMNVYSAHDVCNKVAMITNKTVKSLHSSALSQHVYMRMMM